jgi:hypothetical protein
MLERLDNIIYMLLVDLKEGNPIIKLAQREDAFEGYSRTNLYIYIELSKGFQVPVSYLAELERLFGSGVGLVEDSTTGCKILKTKIPLENIKNFEETE